MHEGAEQQASEQQARQQMVWIDHGAGQQDEEQTAWMHDGAQQQASGKKEQEQAVLMADGVGQRERKQVVRIPYGAERQARDQARHHAAPKDAGEEQQTRQQAPLMHEEEDERARHWASRMDGYAQQLSLLRAVLFAHQVSQR